MKREREREGGDGGEGREGKGREGRDGKRERERMKERERERKQREIFAQALKVQSGCCTANSQAQHEERNEPLLPSSDQHRRCHPVEHVELAALLRTNAQGDSCASACPTHNRWCHRAHVHLRNVTDHSRLRSPTTTGAPTTGSWLGRQHDSPAVRFTNFAGGEPV